MTKCGFCRAHGHNVRTCTDPHIMVLANQLSSSRSERELDDLIATFDTNDLSVLMLHYNPLLNASISRQSKASHVRRSVLAFSNIRVTPSAPVPTPIHSSSIHYSLTPTPQQTAQEIYNPVLLSEQQRRMHILPQAHEQAPMRISIPPPDIVAGPRTPTGPPPVRHSNPGTPTAPPPSQRYITPRYVAHELQEVAGTTVPMQTVISLLPTRESLLQERTLIERNRREHLRGIAIDAYRRLEVAKEHMERSSEYSYDFRLSAFTASKDAIMRFIRNCSNNIETDRVEIMLELESLLTDRPMMLTMQPRLDPNVTVRRPPVPTQQDNDKRHLRKLCVSVEASHINENQKDEKKECVLCIDEYSSSEGIVLSCSHELCVTCLTKMAEIRTKSYICCPFCRTEVKSCAIVDPEVRSNVVLMLRRM